MVSGDRSEEAVAVGSEVVGPKKESCLSVDDGIILDADVRRVFALDVENFHVEESTGVVPVLGFELGVVADTVFGTEVEVRQREISVAFRLGAGRYSAAVGVGVSPVLDPNPSALGSAPALVACIVPVRFGASLSRRPRSSPASPVGVTVESFAVAALRSVSPVLEEIVGVLVAAVAVGVREGIGGPVSDL